MCEISEEGATYIAENCRCRPPHCRLTHPPTAVPANIHLHLIYPETRVILPFWSISFKFLQWAPEHECVPAIQGHPRSMISVPVESV